MTAQELISLQQVDFAYDTQSNGNGWLYRDFDFCLMPSSITAIMGPSGSGKSTLGLLIAGMLHANHGRIERASALAEPKDVVYIDQQAMNSVFPWQNVRTNVEYPLRRLGWSPPRAKERVDELLQRFGMDTLVNAFPRQLSGGELQRLALCRCLSWKPRLIILDESLSALDPKMKTKAIAALYEIAAGDDITIVLITHSIADAMMFATRCIVLSDRPVRIACDVAVDCPFPRDENSPGFSAAQEAIIGTIRHGIM